MLLGSVTPPDAVINPETPNVPVTARPVELNVPIEVPSDFITVSALASIDIF